MGQRYQEPGMPVDLRAPSQSAFEQVAVTTPDGQQILVTKYLASGSYEVSWRVVAHNSETWRPLGPDDWYVERQD